jgi:hypothetical protein
MVHYEIRKKSLDMGTTLSKGFDLYRNHADKMRYSVRGVLAPESYKLCEICVDIKIQLLNNGEITTYEWSKKYIAPVSGTSSMGRTGDGNVKEILWLGDDLNLNPTTAGIWPRQNVKGWKSYYFFCLVEENGYYIEPIHGKHITDDSTGNPADANPTFMNPSDVIPHKLGKLTYYRFDCFPEFLLLKNSRGSIMGYIPLNAEPAFAIAKSDVYKIAIDFGTSSTSIYRALGTAAADKFECNGLGAAAICFNPLRFSGGGVFDYFTQFFIPHNSKSYSIPFQSLLHDFLPISKKGENATPRRHIFDAQIAHILLTPQYSPINGSEIDSDLKWGNIAANVRLKVFFRQLARITALDALMRGYSDMQVYASYPGAKSGDTTQVEQLVEQFRITLADDLEKIGSNTAVRLAEPPTLITEGLAAALHFQKKSNERFRCVIDIGGGTSDFFVYQLVSNETGKYRAIDSSVKFGSRDIFVDVLCTDAKKSQEKLNSAKGLDQHEKDMLLNDIILYYIVTSENYTTSPPGATEASLKKHLKKGYGLDSTYGVEDRIQDILASAGDENTFRMLFETLLAYPIGDRTVGDELHQSLTALDKYTLNQRMFLTILAVGIASITYYSGMLARTFEGGIHSDKVDFCFAGNGSKILRWLQFSNKTSARDAFLSSIFSSALNCGDVTHDTAISVRISNEPKLEAASGMLSGKNIDLVNDDIVPSVILSGEMFRDDKDREYSATTDINDEILCTVQNAIRKTNVDRTKIDSAEFKTFVKAYNSAVVKTFGTDFNRPLLVLDYLRDEDLYYGNDETIFPFDQPDMENNRLDDFKSYIENVLEDKSNERERTPFFFLEVKTLINSLLKEFVKVK